MTPEEAQTWLAETRRSRNQWIADSIHDSPHDTLFFKGGERGSFVHIRAVKGGHVVEIGDYEDAFPHIGDAAFQIKGRKPFPDFEQSLRWLMVKMPELSAICSSRLAALEPLPNRHDDEMIDHESEWERQNIR